MDDVPSIEDGRRAKKEANVLAVLGPELAAARPAANPGPLVFQYRVLKALVLRDMASRHGDSRLGYLMSIVMPVIGLSFLIVVFSFRGKIVPADFSLAAFVITGYPLWQGFIGMYRSVMTKASQSDSLLMFPQITQLDLIFSEIILQIATNTVIFVLMVIGVLLVFQEFPDDLVGVLMVYWACMWIGCGLGLLMCGLNRIVPGVVGILNLFMRLGMWMSGVVFSVNRLPPFLWPYLKWNPILHCIEGARHLWSPTFEAPIFDPVYIISCGVLLTTVGLMVERATRRFVGS